MKNIERFQRIRHAKKKNIYLVDKTGVIVRTEQLDQLESTIEELVEFLIGEAMNLSPPMRNYRGAAYYRVKDKLETLTGKTWEELKEGKL